MAPFFQYEYRSLLNMNHRCLIPTHEFSVHIHDMYEIYYFLSGDVTYLIEGSTYHLQPHDLLLINTGELHRPVFNSSAPYERLVIHFRPEYISAFQTQDYNLLYCFERRKLGQNNLLLAEDIYDSSVHKLFHQLTDFSFSSPEKDLLFKTYFIQLLIALNQIFSKQKTTETSAVYDDKISQVLHYINDHLHEKISLEQLENKFFINKYYLCHLFKKNTGITIGDYISHKRILKAKELLILGVPVSEVAHAIGYEDYSTFYRTFKRLTGVSPKSYLAPLDMPLTNKNK